MRTIYQLLLVLFIALKLCGIIHWKWIWVVAPLWGPICMWLIGHALIKLGEHLNRPRTPEEALARKCREIAEALRRHK